MIETASFFEGFVMKRYLMMLILCAALIISFGESPAAEPLIGEGDELTLERCLEIAVKNQPVIMQYLYTSQANEAQLGQAKSGYYPQLDAYSSFTRYNAVKQTGDPYPPINTAYGYKYGDNTLTLPIALGIGAGGESRQPLGVAVVGGLFFSQFLTMYITPVFYVYIDKLNTRLTRRKRVKMPAA